MLPRPPSKISLASLPTPIRKLPRLSAKLGGPTIWVKEDYLSGFTLSGNKVRKLEYLISDAMENGATDVITCGGIQSNHCRATAFACAQLGLKCHLILRHDEGFKGHSSEGEANHFLDIMAGAETNLYSASDYQSNLPQIFSEVEERIKIGGGTPYSIPTGGSNGLGVWGYLQCVQEIKTQCDELGFEPDMLVCASGSGGTQAGLVLGVHHYSLQARVLAYAVCDSAKYFERKVKTDILDCCVGSGLSKPEASLIMDKLKIETNDHYIGPGYAKAEAPLYDFIKEIASLEGLLLDPVYTGKAFYGMISELKKGYFDDQENILFIHTGGGFGLFSHASYYTNDYS